MPSFRISLIAASFFALFQAPHAQAFHLEDHERIMKQAMSEFQVCFPNKLSADTQKAIWQSDLNEDLNIFLKDTLYSHFYNPTKKLEMRRYDSSVRVKDKQSELITIIKTNADLNESSNAARLGAAAHHIQDMAVPAHVVPVGHGFGDGFEVYQFKGEISTGWSCSDIGRFSAGEDLRSIHKQTAMLTLTKVMNTQNSGLTGQDFWQPSSNSSFGHYGSVGNHFGQSKIVVNGRTLQIDPTFYDQLKQSQMKLAVQESLKALYWYSRLVH